MTRFTISRRAAVLSLAGTALAVSVGTGVSVATSPTVAQTPGATAVAQAGAHSHAPKTSAQRALWGNWVKVWNGDYDRAPGIISPKFRVHVSLLDGSSDTAIRGVDGLTTWIKQSRAMFNDFKITTQVGPFVDGKHIVGRWAATGTYAGGVPGATAPIGTKIAFTGTDILRTEHGKVVEYWLHSDTIALLGQLGVGAK